MSNSEPKKKTHFAPVLYADDDETDACLLRLAFERAGVSHPLVVVGDGQQAVDYLAGAGGYANRSLHPMPALVLLDIKVPRLSGFEVLSWMATRPEQRAIPAVILSSSSHESDIEKARQLPARDYFTKPHAMSDLVKIVQHHETQWLHAETSRAAL